MEKVDFFSFGTIQWRILWSIFFLGCILYRQIITYSDRFYPEGLEPQTKPIWGSNTNKTHCEKKFQFEMFFGKIKMPSFNNMFFFVILKRNHLETSFRENKVGKKPSCDFVLVLRSVVFVLQETSALVVQQEPIKGEGVTWALIVKVKSSSKLKNHL